MLLLVNSQLNLFCDVDVTEVELNVNEEHFDNVVIIVFNST